MSSWLKNQTKKDVVLMAEAAKFPGDTGVKKELLAPELAAFLNENASSLQNHPALADYYRAQAPVRKPARKRTTKGPGEVAADIAAATTPRAVQRVAAKTPLPPSPLAVAEYVEHQTHALRRRWDRLWNASGLEPYVDQVRLAISSVVGVAFLMTAIEAWGLQRVTLPWRHAFAFTIPFAKALGLGQWDTIAVFFPDFFVLLTGNFWAPSALWLATSILIPAGVGAVVNFTIHGSKRRAYDVDPFVFFFVKGIVTWLVYAEGLRFYGLVAEKTVRVVQAALPGGWFGVALGCHVGVTTSLYEAVIRTR